MFFFIFWWFLINIKVVFITTVKGFDQKKINIIYVDYKQLVTDEKRYYLFSVEKQKLIKTKRIINHVSNCRYYKERKFPFFNIKYWTIFFLLSSKT